MRGHAQLNLRLPRRLHKKLASLAKQRGSSLNGELVRRLDESVEREPVAERLAALTKEVARVGRPTKDAAPGSKASLGLKIIPSLKVRLEREAANNGRTQSQEAEARLERSFDHQDLINDLLAAARGSASTTKVRP